MQRGLSDERLSVCTPVGLSVKRVNCDKTKAPSEKSSIMTNSKSPMSFPMSLRRTAYVAPNPQRGPQQVAQLSQRNRAAAWVSFGWVVDDGVGQTAADCCIILKSGSYTNAV